MKVTLPLTYKPGIVNSNGWCLSQEAYDSLNDQIRKGVSDKSKSLFVYDVLPDNDKFDLDMSYIIGVGTSFDKDKLSIEVFDDNFAQTISNDEEIAVSFICSNLEKNEEGSMIIDDPVQMTSVSLIDPKSSCYHREEEIG